MARAIWEGNISFGLINIPIELYSLEKKVDLNFHMVDSRDRARIHYVRVNEETGDEVPWDQIAKGYEYKDGQYVVLDKEHLDELHVKSTQTIDLNEFVDLDEIPYPYFEKPYLLLPTKKSQKSYALLVKALDDLQKVALGKVSIRMREHLAAVISDPPVLILNLLRFHEELREISEFEIPKMTGKGHSPSKKEVDLAEELVKNLTAKWDPEKYKDEYRTALHKYVSQQIKHPHKKPRKTKAKAAKEPSNVIDIAGLLQQSLKKNKKKVARIMDPLREYHRKRDFKRTSEPRGGRSKISGSRDFMIHLHDATRLHYDLRLQWNGVLLSWAVPKGPSFDPEDKRLAVQTEDHPVDYKNFEGVIPENSYGAGPSLIWDAGTWRPLVKDVKKALAKGKLRFFLRGVRLRGIWNLIKLHHSKKGNEWLLIKEYDRYAKPKLNGSLRDHTSVATGRDLTNLDEPAEPEGATQFQAGPLDWNTRPQLATLTQNPPHDVENWIVEDKYDGYRILAFKENDVVRLQTRNGKDWTEKIPELKAAILALPVESILMDGELVAQKKRGGPETFENLQKYFKGESGLTVHFYVFDVLHLDQYDLKNQNQQIRRQILESLFQEFDSHTLRLSKTFSWSNDLLERQCFKDAEGLIIKKPDSHYVEARTKNWLKLKCGHREEYAVIGWTAPRGSRSHLGSLLLAEEVDGDWIFRGRVGTGFDADSLKQTYEKLKPYVRSTCPLKKCPRLKNVQWTDPRLYAEIRFREMSQQGHLRHPVFLGLREDKMRSRARTKTMPTVSHPQKIYYPEDKLTKQDILDYYSTVEEAFLKMATDRPLSLVRCPNGYKKCFFQKHMDDESKHPRQKRIKTTHQNALYPYIHEFEDVRALIQLGTLEFHAWNCTIQKSEKPQYIVWDLDPGANVPFSTVTQSAHLIRLILEKFGYQSFVRTTGGKGLHVLAEADGRTWDEAKKFSYHVGELLKEADPNLYLLTATKSKRNKKIYVDYLRNSKGATSILNYSTRARPHAPVATPLFWEEVHEDLDPSAFTVKTVPKRLNGLKNDPWAALTF